MEEPQLIAFLKSEGQPTIEPPTDALGVHFLTGLEEEIKENGTHYMVSQYGCLLTAFKTYDRSNDHGIIKASLKCLNTAIKTLTKEFKVDSTNVRDLDRDKKQSLRKSLVVAIFLTYKAFQELETEALSDRQNITITNAAQVTKRRGKKKVVEVADDGRKYAFWESSRAKITSSLVETLSCSWEHLWPEGTNAFKYMRCLTIAFCDTLKNSGEELLAQNFEEVENIFRILGILATRANEEKSIVGRIIPLVKISENLAKVVSQCISHIEQTFEKGTIVGHAMMEAADIYFALIQSETSIERGFATFITELSSLNPNQLIKYISYVCFFLEAESSTVRSAVLTAAADVLSWYKKRTEENEADDDGNDNSNINNVLQLTLLAHSKDSNANVRSKALQLINKLIKNGDLESHDVIACMKAGVKRLLDKGVSVRKQAIQLMVAICNINPLCVKYSVKQLHHQIRKERILLHEMLSKDAESRFQILEIVVDEFVEHPNLPEVVEEDLNEKVKSPEEGMEMIQTAIKEEHYLEACELFLYVQKRFANEPGFESVVGRLAKQVYMKYLADVLQENFPHEKPMDLDSSQNFENIVSSEQVAKKRLFIKSLKETEEMRVILEDVLQTLTIILDKGAPGDKEEVISFFSDIAAYGFRPADGLVVSVVEALAQCKEIDDQMLDKFCRLFLDDPAINIENRGVRSNMILVKKLMGIVDLLSFEQRENIIPLVLLLRKKKIINNECIQLLWDAFTLNSPEWPNKDSSLAAYLLGVVGKAENNIITTNMARLIDVGFGVRGLEDFSLAKSSCEALLFVCKKPKEDDIDELDENLRRPADDPIFENILSLIEKGLREKGNSTLDEHFCSVAELAIQLIYKLCIDPKIVLQKLINELYEWVFGEGKNASQIKDTERLATRYLGVCTSLLGCELLFLDTTVTLEVKRRRTLIQKKEGKSTKEKKGKKSHDVTKSSDISIVSKNSSRSTSKLSSINESTTDGAADAANELDQITGGNSNFENDLEIIKKYNYTMLENGIYRQFKLHALLYCNKINSYKSLHLQIACVRALAKIMSINEHVMASCTKNFEMLWDNVKHPMVKVEMIRSAIPLNQRFPNQMEECTKRITDGLKDKNPTVKKATLDFITYLTLGDLLKIRGGQFPEVAMLVCDDDVDVKEMARDFLKQCAEKENVLMNALPDIISRLNTEVDQETFQSIIKYLLAQIKKDKQSTGMVEKLIARFKFVEESSVQQKGYQNAAFCLTQFPINEKSFKIISENLASYNDKLDDDYVYDCFMEIIKEARKIFKPEAKLKIDEFEKELQDARDKCVEIKRMEDAAAGRGRESPMDQAGHSDSENSEEDDMEVSGEEEGQDGQGPRRRRDRPQNNHSESNGEGSQENDTSKLTTSKLRKKSKQVVKYNDDSESNEEGTQENNGSLSSDEGAFHNKKSAITRSSRSRSARSNISHAKSKEIVQSKDQKRRGRKVIQSESSESNDDGTQQSNNSGSDEQDSSPNKMSTTTRSTRATQSNISQMKDKNTQQTKGPKSKSKLMAQNLVPEDDGSQHECSKSTDEEPLRNSPPKLEKTTQRKKMSKPTIKREPQKKNPKAGKKGGRQESESDDNLQKDASFSSDDD